MNRVPPQEGAAIGKLRLKSIYKVGVYKLLLRELKFQKVELKRFLLLKRSKMSAIFSLSYILGLNDCKVLLKFIFILDKIKKFRYHVTVALNSNLNKIFGESRPNDATAPNFKSGMVFFTFTI